MKEITEIIIWWTGAVVIMALLAVLTMLLTYTIKQIAIVQWHRALTIMQLSTARYWVDRMEREGLTVCREEYRRMVAERKPKTAADYNAVEVEANEAAHGITGESK